MNEFFEYRLCAKLTNNRGSVSLLPHTREGLDFAFKAIEQFRKENILISAAITSSRDGIIYDSEQNC